jgi:hypothetical protein
MLGHDEAAVSQTFKIQPRSAYESDSLYINGHLVTRALKQADLLGKSLDQLICDYLQKLADDDPERSIEEFRHLSARGSSRGCSFNRSEIHQRSHKVK